MKRLPVTDVMVIELRNDINIDVQNYGLIRHTSSMEPPQSRPPRLSLNTDVKASKNISNEQFQKFDLIINSSDGLYGEDTFLQIL